jgi:hypothetical protein
MAYEIFRASRFAQRMFSDYARVRRMQEFCRRTALHSSMRVLDLGGTPAVWQHVQPRCNITIVNLPGAAGAHIPSHHRLSFHEGDACNLPEFDDLSFDLVFSNSVIEHVGDETRQEAFAREVRRIGKSYWVQTPAKWFPIEAHTAMPLWWFYPEGLRKYFLRRWRVTLPAWSDSMAETRVLSRNRMQQLFPESEIYVEGFAGLPKSYAACWRAPS